MKFLRNIFLRLCSYLYGWGVALRNYCYDTQRLPAIEFDLPVIVVGNLTAGGTGKTPHVEYIAQLLLQRHYQVASLSRGYRRRSSGFVLADVHSTADQIGDEPMQLYAKLHPQGLSVAVCENRALGISLLVSHQPQLNAVLLDDAYQHRAVKASLNILLTDYRRLFCNDHLLPYGMLREPAHQKRRAHVVIVTKTPDSITASEQANIAQQLALLPHQTLLFSYLRYGDIYPLASPHLPAYLYQQTAAVLLCGIAQPQYVQQYLAQKIHAVVPLLYPDHHRYQPADLHRLQQAYQQLTLEHPHCRHLIITTEKDATRLAAHSQLLQTLQLAVWVLPVEVYFAENHQQILEQLIEDTIEKFD